MVGDSKPRSKSSLENRPLLRQTRIILENLLLIRKNLIQLLVQGNVYRCGLRLLNLSRLLLRNLISLCRRGKLLWRS